jgi:D-alanyl-D-alanine carboxypeptidase/D-alanyl-D-alanine-endopeptidase (penicillin-binding protein 4)
VSQHPSEGSSPSGASTLAGGSKALEGSILLDLRAAHRTRAWVLAGLIALLVGGAATLAWLLAHPHVPGTLALHEASDAGEDHLRFAGYHVVPERARAPSPPSPLELRLRSFAEAVEQARARLDPPLVAFGAEALTEEIERVIAQVDSKAEVSVHVRDLDSSRILFDYQGDLLLNPASNTKLLTGAAALDLLGPDFTYETAVLRVGRRLYLVGSGDPTIDGDRLRTLARSVARVVELADIDAIVFDESAFSPRSFGPGFAPEWTDEGYMAPSGALSLAFNTVEITAYAIGTKDIGVALEPPSTNLRVERVEPQRRRLVIRALADPLRPPDQPGTLIRVEGGAGVRVATTRRRVLAPGPFAAGAFAAALAERSGRDALPVEPGVAPLRLPAALGEGELPRTLGTTREGEAVELVGLLRSPPLLDIVATMLAWSNNHIAEQLVRTLAARMTGKPGDWQDGCEVVRSYWQTIGEEPEQLVYVNGSGLTHDGRVSTRGLVDMLTVVHHAQTPGESLIDVLPVAGSQGTLRGRLRRSGKRVRAKTGTMTGVSGLTGVITSDEGEPIVAFSIIINVRGTTRMAAERRRTIEDRIVMAVLGHIDGWEAVRGELILDLEPLDVRAGDSGDEAR